MKDKVLLGMSGGVDSSVAAILLKEQGYEVIGVTMKLWEDENSSLEGSCCGLSATCDAKRVCDILNLPHYTLNFKSEFKKHVVDDFICEYKNCRTPNPCIECNKYLKFGAMYQKAKELGCKYIATGHYAKIEYDENLKMNVLKKSDAIKKDQSYVLYNTPKELLNNILFPLGSFKTKDEIRKIAKDYGLKIAHKKDSEDICFVPEGNYKEFLEKNSDITQRDGNILNLDGKILGKHKGLYRYTIGQRRGLGISNKTPLFVTGFNKEENELIVGEEKFLYGKEVFVNNVNLLLIDKLQKPLRVKAKIRYLGPEADATIYDVGEDKIKVVFDKPQKAITPGQSAVFYVDDKVLGGGKII